VSCEEPDSADLRQDRIHTLDVVQIDAHFPLQLAALRAKCGGALVLPSRKRLEIMDCLYAALRLPGGGLHRLQRRAASVHPHHSVQDPVLLCEARVVLRKLAASPIYRHRAPRYADDTENIKTFAGDAGHAGNRTIQFDAATPSD